MKKSILCDHCNNSVEKEDFNYENEICNNCIDDLPNKTGWCSVNCRLGYGCDNTC